MLIDPIFDPSLSSPYSATLVVVSTRTFSAVPGTRASVACPGAIGILSAWVGVGWVHPNQAALYAVPIKRAGIVLGLSAPIIAVPSGDAYSAFFPKSCGFVARATPVRRC